MATNCLCQADLLKRRNWNLRRIRQFLDPPDTVIRIENSEAFLQDVQYSKRRVVSQLQDFQREQARARQAG
jgi:hypothetical protein